MGGVRVGKLRLLDVIETILCFLFPNDKKKTILCFFFGLNYIMLRGPFFLRKWTVLFSLAHLTVYCIHSQILVLSYMLI